MASDKDRTEDAVTRAQSDGDVSSSKPLLQNVDNRLVTLSEKINMCNDVLNDLKDLNDVLERKFLQDVSLPPHD